MNVIQTDTIVLLLILWGVAIAIIIYDRIKYRKYYASQGKLIVLRLNNAYIRQKLEAMGFNLCQCAYFDTNRYLYTIEGDRICGFTESCTHLISDAATHRQPIVDCGIDLNRFVYEIQKVKREYTTEDKS